jgi:hypothetical protein
LPASASYPGVADPIDVSNSIRARIVLCAVRDSAQKIRPSRRFSLTVLLGARYENRITLPRGTSGKFEACPFVTPVLG